MLKIYLNIVNGKYVLNQITIFLNGCCQIQLKFTIKCILFCFIKIKNNKKMSYLMASKVYIFALKTKCIEVYN